MRMRVTNHTSQIFSLETLNLRERGKSLNLEKKLKKKAACLRKDGSCSDGASDWERGRGNPAVRTVLTPKNIFVLKLFSHAAWLYDNSHIALRP